MSNWWGTAVGVIILFGVLETCHCQTTGDCSLADSCDGCIMGDLSINLTGCVWRQCDNDNYTGCVSDSEDTLDCSVFNDTSICSANDVTPEPTPVYSQANFNLSSFIGGVILVLVLQAGAFFAMKFVKSKDSTYETIEQPQ
ncbi:CD164 sialomucin-like 2 protein isoform X2 [Conger conger]|uniref:CD164 sialomucin-like 2 protein isoform X2 n=1 Tax=Conger conger TaxID=82655 RepID=UPI002A5AE843|nr:CD164 sialomucin-like 2 protein isoform X2 [Conger conger]